MTGGLLSQGVRDVLSVAGVAVTTIGFIIAIVQLWRLASTAEAAAKAAQGAKQEISRYDVARDVEAAIRTAEHLKALIRNDNFEEAVWRLGDLRAKINALRTAPQLRGASRDDEAVDFQGHLVNLQTLEDTLANNIRGLNGDWAPDNARRVLTSLSDDLGREAGKLRFAVTAGEET